MAPDKFKKWYEKPTFGGKPTSQILEDLDKSVTQKIIPIIKKKYPRIERDFMQNDLSYYQDMKNLFEQPDEYTLEERIQEYTPWLTMNIIKLNKCTKIKQNLSTEKWECSIRIYVVKIEKMRKSTNPFQLQVGLGVKKEEVRDDFKQGLVNHPYCLPWGCYAIP